MLIELNIKQKARLRPDGIFEIRPTIAGKRISIYGKSAEELSEKLKKALLQPISAPKAKMTLHPWLDEWLTVYKKPNVAEKTFYNLECCVRNYLLKLKDKPLNRFTPTELTQLLNGIESTRMRKYARGTLRDAFRCAVIAGHLKISPAENLLPVKHIVTKGKAIALTDLRDMISRAAQTLPRNVWLYYVATLFAGLRRNEALEIKKKDCDFKNHVLFVRGTKTELSERRVPMFPILEKILRACDGEDSQNIFQCGLFTVNHQFATFRGDSPATLHWLRHTFGTVQICILGVPVNTVALWMGHSDAKTTMNSYTHPEDLAPDIFYGGNLSEAEKLNILNQRWEEIISIVENNLG